MQVYGCFVYDIVLRMEIWDLHECCDVAMIMSVVVQK